MKPGDFTELAKNYIYRPAYNDLIIDALLKYTGFYEKKDFTAADVGAGTGKLTKMLLERGVKTIPVEPNNAMREEGFQYTKKWNTEWREGSGEATGLPDQSVDWVTMASSFHWTDHTLSLPEFHRILKPGGYLTVIWNPRNIEASELGKKIENRIFEIVPTLKRVSSGSQSQTKKWEEILVSTGHFNKTIFFEVDHLEIMTQERYLGAWNSVNDIRSQAGEEKWCEIMRMIEDYIKSYNTIEIPYKNRAWTVQRI
ncbi:MAG TPA: class I SAM-dependent methyltransferase [Spirochaetota bacterium]|nr:class I SAM-dependent methyltransferase [Spirochaetota bacterium]